MSKGTKKKTRAPLSGEKKERMGSTPAEEIIPESIADLRPAGYNPRVITPDQERMLKNSMKEYGDLGGIIFNVKTGRTVGGHQRVKQLDPAWPIVKEPCTDETGTVATGYIETPHGRFSYREVAWTEDKEKGANVAANKMGGMFDEDILAELLQGLKDTGYDMELTGFDDTELKALLGEENEDGLGEEDPEVEPVEDPFVQTGDLWLLGESRLMVGDSRERKDVDKLMQGEKADLVVTDPPYNVAYESKAGKIENDSMSDAKFDEFLAAFFTSMDYALKPGGCFYVYHAEGQNLGLQFARAIANIKTLLLKQKLVWVKNSAPMSRQDYNWKHEPILYGWKDGAGHFYDGDFSRTTVIDDDIDLSKLGKKELLALVNDMRNQTPSTVIRIDKPAKSDLHPTMKPVRLFERNVYASSRPGEIVLDLCNGSGTTIICCRKTKRKGRGMEIDPRYAQATLLRYRDYCHEEPMLVGPDGTHIPYSVVEKQRTKQ